jgi:hypothetical protein
MGMIGGDPPKALPSFKAFKTYYGTALKHSNKVLYTDL